MVTTITAPAFLRESEKVFGSRDSPMHQGPEFLSSGTMTAGANYWASHAGIFMWRDWQPEVIERDFQKISAAGLTVLRVFPLWPDFQPISSLRTCYAKHFEYRAGEKPLPTDALAPHGLDQTMMERFLVLADLGDKYRIGLVVGLITGWMSGRFFAPPALEHLNAITDPVSIRWQARFVSAFVQQFETHPAIRAWDLGNECNCMAEATRDQAWLWTFALANAIRVADPTRPVISGMHSLNANPQDGWTIRDQGELTDILTTHPYPLFTPHCHREPLNNMRPLLHASAETCLYADISGKPAFVEEFGTLSPMVCGEDVAAAMMRTRLFDLWAHDCRGALWWCAHDQRELVGAPYDWLALERELGLFRADGSAKPALETLSSVMEVITALPFERLPVRRIDAVCILTPGQDNWGVAYSTFILAKQAGFDLRFHFSNRDLPEADLYLLPSIKGNSALSAQCEAELWKRVESGATLYVSFDEGGFLADWVGRSGARVFTSCQRAGRCSFTVNSGAEFSINARLKTVLDVESADVLATDPDSGPVFISASYGQGRVYSLMLPMESSLAMESEAFSPARTQPFFSIYRQFAKSVMAHRVVQKTSPWIGITEHADNEGRVIVVIINYTSQTLSEDVTIASGYVWGDTWVGEQPRSTAEGCELHLPPHSALVARLVRCDQTI